MGKIALISQHHVSARLKIRLVLKPPPFPFLPSIHLARAISSFSSALSVRDLKPSFSSKALNKLSSLSGTFTIMVFRLLFLQKYVKLMRLANASFGPKYCIHSAFFTLALHIKLQWDTPIGTITNFFCWMLMH